MPHPPTIMVSKKAEQGTQAYAPEAPAPFPRVVSDQAWWRPALRDTGVTLTVLSGEDTHAAAKSHCCPSHPQGYPWQPGGEPELVPLPCRYSEPHLRCQGSDEREACTFFFFFFPSAPPTSGIWVLPLAACRALFPFSCVGSPTSLN
jgi:hypothetical protein